MGKTAKYICDCDIFLEEKNLLIFHIILFYNALRLTRGTPTCIKNKSFQTKNRSKYPSSGIPSALITHCLYSHASTGVRLQ